MAWNGEIPCICILMTPRMPDFMAKRHDLQLLVRDPIKRIQVQEDGITIMQILPRCRYLIRNNKLRLWIKTCLLTHLPIAFV